jgi:hypothetical protein
LKLINQSRHNKNKSGEKNEIPGKTSYNSTCDGNRCGMFNSRRR